MQTAKTRVALQGSPDETEQLFYEALQHADLEHLMELWSDDEEISCVHPGGPRLVGAAAIRAAFEAMFQQGAVQVVPERVRRLVHGDTAIHQVLERVQVAGPEGSKSAWVIATNVYVKTDFGWRLAVHHASPGNAHEIQEVVQEATTLH